MKHNALTDRKIASLNTTGRYSDGRGLWLQVSKWGTKSWILRYVGFDGRQRQMGLGSVHDVSLAVARQRAKKAREALSDPDSPIDPVEARRQKREQARIEAAKRITFKTCCEKYIAANEAEWKNDKHKYQWRQTLLGDYCKPLRDLPVDAIDTALVLKVLDPIWDTKRETAVRLRGRIERVLAWATVREYRKGDNPARWQGHLREALNRNGRKIEHHAALPYAELPAFMGELRGKDTASGKALEFTILTAARTGETIGATWDEIDLTAKLWTIPGERMKKGKTHIVPLSDRAVEILSKLPREKGNDHVFVGGKAGAGLSNMAMLELLKDMRPGLTVHGFRSTFSDWAGDRTNFDRQTREFALAHGLTDKTEASYRHMTAVEKRRKLMDAWAKYCASKPVAASNVTPIRARA
jgi:integrase